MLSTEVTSSFAAPPVRWLDAATTAMVEVTRGCRARPAGRCLAISWVAAPCSSTAAEIAIVSSLILPIAWETPLIAETADWDVVWISPTSRRSLSRVRGLVGEVLHLLRHHGETLAGIACPGGLDRGVQGEQVGSGRRRIR